MKRTTLLLIGVLLIAVASWAQGKKKDKKDAHLTAIAYVEQGNAKLAEGKIGEACQLYEQAIYFDPNCKEAYLRFAEAYQNTAPQLSIEKLEELKNIDPAYLPADQALARLYYKRNEFGKAAETYAKFIDSPEATESDITQYAFALFLNHEFEKSLEVANKGLVRNPKHAAFNRLAMYNNADLKRYEEGVAAAEAFFTQAEEADYSYLDYLYYGHLLKHTGQYGQAIEQFTKAMAQDSTKLDLRDEIIDSQLQLGKLYYANQAFQQADSVFAIVAQEVPDNYQGTLWRARAHSGLDPETTEGAAKPYYEAAIALIEASQEERLNPILVEAYSYMGYYYMLKNDVTTSTGYWDKIIALDPDNETAHKALDGIKKMLAGSRRK